jgi:arylsulfatase A-like enzyme
MTRGVPVVVVVTAFVLTGLVGCGHDSGPPNILVVVLDTLRADAAGNHTDATPAPLRVDHLTPNLDALAARGVTFDDCTSVAPWTVPSHASMFTGRLPSVHGCVTGGARLDPGLSTFADQLRRVGFATAAFFSNPWLADRTTGLLRGFNDRIEARLPIATWKGRRGGDQGGEASVAEFRSWISKREDGRPFLAFVNILESHLAYDPPSEYRGLHLRDLSPLDTVGLEWSQRYQAELIDHDAVDWNRVARLYAGDVWRADRLLGHVVESLRLAGRDRDTVVIVTSDHGEHLGEHGLVEHQFSVYEPLLRVPLVVVVPKPYRGRFHLGAPVAGVREDPVQTIDLHATVLELAGIPPSVGTPFSRSLFAAPMEGERAVYAEYAGPLPGLMRLLHMKNPRADLSRYRRALRSVRLGDLRLIADDRGGEQLFDLRTDPAQRHDLGRDRPADREALRALIDRLEVSTPTAGRGPEMDAETLEQLRSLGYVP